MSDYASYLDIPYPSATDTRQALDLFIPPHADHNSPLIVFIHGQLGSPDKLVRSNPSYSADIV